MTGRVLLVGAGPGAADLLTIRAAEAIRHADVVLYDRLVSRDILRLIPPTAESIDVGKRPGNDDSQGEILNLLVAHADAGREVVRLKGGDPMVFGRGGEEATYLSKRGIAVEVVPGVTSAIGVPSSIGLPLTLRHVASGFAVVAGQALVPDDWARYAGVDTLVILMGAARRVSIAADLIGAGRPADDPAAFIEAGTTSLQHVTVSTLSEVAAGRVEVAPPMVWVCGPVVNTLRAGLVDSVAVAD